MTDHPLTEDECKRIAACYPYNGVDIEDCGHIHDMRAAYDLAIEHVKKKVKSNLKIWRRSGYSSGADAAEDFFEEIMQELRPQEES